MLLKVLGAISILFGIALLGLAVFFHLEMDAIIGIPFVGGAAIGGVTLVMWGIRLLVMQWADPTSDAATEERFRRRFM